MSEPLWPNSVDLDIIGLSGEVESGKTMFGLSIADPERTLVFDVEKSSSVYKPMGFKHVDLQQILYDKFPNGYAPVDVYDTWKKLLGGIQPGKWDVIMLDPADDMEQGLVESVTRRANDFGFSTPESFRKSGGIFWSYVRNEWKHITLALANKCQTFVFTTHMRTVWINGSATKDREPKGKDTLDEIATVYLILDRSPDQDGKVPIEPRATVRKSRLCAFQKVEGKLVKVPILPPRLPVATPEAIREYIINPPDYTDLKEGERPVTRVFTEEEKLTLQAQIATEQRTAAEANALAEERRLQANQAVDRARSILRPDETPAPPKEDKPEAQEAQPQEADVKEDDSVGVTSDDILKLIGEADKKGLKDKLVAKMKERKGLAPDSKVTAKDFVGIPRDDYDKYLKIVEEY